MNAMKNMTLYSSKMQIHINATHNFLIPMNLEAILFPKISTDTTSITNTYRAIYFHLFVRLPSKIIVILGIICCRSRIQIQSSYD